MVVVVVVVWLILCSFSDYGWFFQSNLDLPEVHRLADQFVVLRELLSRRQLDENLAQLTPAGAAGIGIARARKRI